MNRYVVLLGGEAPEHLARPKADLIVAADGGGYRHARRWGWEPDRIVGDFDSIEAGGFPAGVDRHHLPDQHSTDFEKALSGLPRESEARLDVIGGMGGRADHQQTNLLIAAAVPAAWSVVVHGASEELYRATPACPVGWTAPKGETVSILPFSRAGAVTATGLRWPLDAVDMGAGQQLGQSNEALGGPVTVSLQRGVLWVWRKTL